MSPLLLLLPTALAAPPDTPSLVQPADGDQHVAVPPTLTVHATDPDGDPLTVSLEVRPLWEPGEDFTLVALPDTQYYACGCNGGLPETFSAQTAWVVEALATRDIVFVTQLGDCVENGDAVPEEWEVADAAFTLLEDPVTTGLEEGVPYGIAVGNHDQSPAGDPDGATAYYNATFGVDRFAGRSWYGGHRGDDNDDHYQLFEAGHTGYVILHLEYDPAPSEEDLAWAVGVLEEHADRLAIVVSHHLIGTDGAWGAQGAATWEALRDQPNLLLMLSGHVPGVGRRSDTSGERTVHTLLADYQMEANGGDGWLRLLTFSPAPRGIAPERGLVTVETWSPTRGEYDTSPENAFVLEADLSPPFAPVGEPVAVSSGETAAAVYTRGQPGQSYEWRAVVSDGSESTVAPVWSFRVAEGAPDTGRDTAVADDTSTDTEPPQDTGGPLAAGGACGCGAGAPGAGLAGLLLGLVAVHRRKRDPEHPRASSDVAC